MESESRTVLGALRSSSRDLMLLLDRFAEQLIRRADECPEASMLKETHTFATLVARVVRIGLARQRCLDDLKVNEFAVRTARKIQRQIVSEARKYQVLMQRRQSENFGRAEPPCPQTVSASQSTPTLAASQPPLPERVNHAPNAALISKAMAVLAKIELAHVSFLPKSLTTKFVFTKIMLDSAVFCQNHCLPSRRHLPKFPRERPNLHFRHRPTARPPPILSCTPI